VELFFKAIEEGVPIPWRFVSDVVDRATEGIERDQMRPHPPRNKPRDKGKVLIMGTGKADTQRIGFGERRGDPRKLDQRSEVLL